MCAIGRDSDPAISTGAGATLGGTLLAGATGGSSAQRAARTTLLTAPAGAAGGAPAPKVGTPGVPGGGGKRPQIIQ